MMRYLLLLSILVPVCISHGWPNCGWPRISRCCPTRSIWTKCPPVRTQPRCCPKPRITRVICCPKPTPMKPICCPTPKPNRRICCPKPRCCPQTYNYDKNQMRIRQLHSVVNRLIAHSAWQHYHHYPFYPQYHYHPW